MAIEIPPIQVHGSRSLILFFISSPEKDRKFTKGKGANFSIRVVRRCLPLHLHCPLVPHLVVNRPCWSRTGLRVVLGGEEESRPLACCVLVTCHVSRAGLRVVLGGEERGGGKSRPLALILGHVASLTAPLPFARYSDGGRSNRASTTPFGEHSKTCVTPRRAGCDFDFTDSR